MELSSKRKSAPFLLHAAVAIEKEAFGSSLTTVNQLSCMYDCYSKSSNPHPERRAKDDFYNNTQPHGLV